MKTSFFAALVLAGGMLVHTTTTTHSQNMKRMSRGGDVVTVSVNFSMMMPGNPSNPEAASALQQKGRRVLYSIAAGECLVLMDTIAETCEVARISVSSRLTRHRQATQGITMSSNASYRIVIKK